MNVAPAASTTAAGDGPPSSAPGKSARLQPAAAAPVEAAPAPAPPVAAPVQPAPIQPVPAQEAAVQAATKGAVSTRAGAASGRPIDPAEAEALLRRSEAFIAQGDIASARLLLQRAADGRNARAALVLAGTYDPAILSKLRVYGVPGDPAKAREWYEKARELGSPEASARLELSRADKDAFR